MSKMTFSIPYDLDVSTFNMEIEAESREEAIAQAEQELQDAMQYNFGPQDTAEIEGWSIDEDQIEVISDEEPESESAETKE